MKNDIKSKMESSVIGWNTVFYESYDLMQDYYNGTATHEDISDYIWSVCKFGAVEKSRTTELLGTFYEYISRANTRNAVESNMQEAEDFYISMGMKTDAGNHYSNRKGGIYYNAKHYHDCEDMQEFIRQTIDDVAGKYGACSLDYANIEKSNLFPDGGVTYNGVWNQKTYELIHYHGMEDMEFIAKNYVPLESLIYCETNFHIENEGVLSKIKEHLNERMPMGENQNLLLEMERQGTAAGSHKEARERVHSFLVDKGVPLRNTADRMWMQDYFGMAFV